MPALSFLKCVLSAAMFSLGGAAFAPAAQPADDQLPARCEGAGCAKVATPVSWPDVRLEDPTTPFTVHGTFTFQLPKGPLEFLLQDNGFIAPYADRRWIGVQVLTAAALGLPRRDGVEGGRSGALGLADMPRIAFTKTPADPEPRHAEDLQLWRIALVFKNGTFEKATQLQVAQRGPLTAYFADSGVGSTTGTLEVVHAGIKDWYLFVQFKGFSFDDVRRVVASIDVRPKP